MRAVCHVQKCEFYDWIRNRAQMCDATQGWEKFKRSIHVRRNHTQTWLIRSPKWLIAMHTGSEKKRKNMGLEDRLGTFANASKFTVGFFLRRRGLPKTTNFRTNFGK